MTSGRKNQKYDWKVRSKNFKTFWFCFTEEVPRSAKQKLHNRQVSPLASCLKCEFAPRSRSMGSGAGGWRRDHLDVYNKDELRLWCSERSPKKPEVEATRLRNQIQRKWSERSSRKVGTWRVSAGRELPPPFGKFERQKVKWKRFEK